MANNYLTVDKREGRFVVDNMARPGSPACGYGRTIKEALGDYMIANQGELDISLAFVGSVKLTEKRAKARLLRGISKPKAVMVRDWINVEAALPKPYTTVTASYYKRRPGVTSNTFAFEHVYLSPTTGNAWYHHGTDRECVIQPTWWTY